MAQLYEPNQITTNLKEPAVFATPPDLIAVDAQDLMALPHSDLFAVRQPKRA